MAVPRLGGFAIDTLNYPLVAVYLLPRKLRFILVDWTVIVIPVQEELAIAHVIRP